jgi:hypothetical protein
MVKIYIHALGEIQDGITHDDILVSVFASNLHGWKMKFLCFWLIYIWLDDEIPTFLVEMLHMIG